MRRTLGILALTIVLVAATPAAFGGWAVVTLHDVPEYLEVGEPTTLAFTLRQHGERLLDDRSPTVTLGGGRGGLFARWLGRGRVAAVKSAEPGRYVATVTPADTGEVSLTIDTDLARWRVRLLPLRVVSSGAVPPPMSAYERGQQLFAAKGCATCHLKRDDEALAEWDVISVGPDLANRSFPPEWLEQKLADPARYRTRATNGVVMPNLELEPDEIAALVSYINRGHEVVTESAER